MCANTLLSTLWTLSNCLMTWEWPSMNMEGHSMNLENSSMNVECVPSISSVCHFHKIFTLKLVKLLMLWESYQKWSSTWDCDSIYSIESVLMVTQLDLSKTSIWISHQSYICHSWFRLNSLFFETPCTIVEVYVVTIQYLRYMKQQYLGWGICSSNT